MDPFDLVGQTLDGKYRVDAMVGEGSSSGFAKSLPTEQPLDTVRDVPMPHALTRSEKSTRWPWWVLGALLLVAGGGIVAATVFDPSGSGSDRRSASTDNDDDDARERPSKEPGSSRKKSAPAPKSWTTASVLHPAPPATNTTARRSSRMTARPSATRATSPPACDWRSSTGRGPR